jgi:hypothetical protein
MKKILYPLLTTVSTLLYAGLNPPLNLILEPSTNSVKLTWSDNSDSESGFKIFRDNRLIAITKPNTTSYEDMGLKPSTLYKYTIKATDDRDSNYLYHDGRDVIIEVVSNGESVEVGEGVGIWQSDEDGNSKALIEAYEYNGFFANKDDRLDSTYKIVKKVGGFDIVYNFTNNQDIDLPLPILTIPDIGFGDIDSLNVVNPLFKHYLEVRSLQKERIDNERYFNVANIFRTIDEETYEEHYPYGTQFVYSPVIVATNGDFAVGCSLELNYNQAKYRLKPLMRIIKKDRGFWNYEFDLQNDKLKSHNSIDLTITVRVAKSSRWIFTLHPYKEFLHNEVTKSYRRSNDKKDLRPIQAIEMGGFDDGVGSRFWSPDVVNKENVMDLYWLLDKKGSKLDKMGFERMVFWNFTGLYKNINETNDTNDTQYGSLQEQLPFQFISNEKGILPDDMRKDFIELQNEKDHIFNSFEVGYDWGISGNIPIDENGKVLKNGVWQPYNIVPFDLDIDTHVAYANHILEGAKEIKGLFKPKFIRLDALLRMDSTKDKNYIDDIRRIEWIQHLQKSMPYTTFATESSIDYIHSIAANILQPDSIYGWKGVATQNEQNLHQPDLLASYLNPSSETYVWMNANAQLKDDNGNEYPFRDNSAYVKSLVELGYTPLIDYWDVVDVRGIDTSLPECMDRIDNDNNGYIDWPYEDGCSSPSDRSE